MVEQTNTATQNLLGINRTLAELASRSTVSGQSTQGLRRPGYARVA